MSGEGPTKQITGQTRPTAIVVAHENGLDSLERAVKAALTVGEQNQFAMTFEHTGDDGVTTITPYIKKPGMSFRLNDAAKKKGGIVYSGHIIIRSQWETAEALMKLFSSMSEQQQKAFLASRNNNYGCLTLSTGVASAYYCIIFKNGEKWEGTATASRSNVKMGTMHTRLDELAKTRAFRQTLCYGLGDGFLPTEAICGDDDWEAAEQELAAEQEAEAQEHITSAGVALDSTARFRLPGTSNGNRVVDGFASAEDAGGPGRQMPAAPESPETGGESAHESDGRGERHHGPSSGPVPDINTLMRLARAHGILLIEFVREHLGVDSLARLTAEQCIRISELLQNTSEN